jgi:hypothetical protein
MAMTPEEVYQLNAVEAQKRDVARAIARLDGQVQAGQVAIATLTRLIQDTGLQRRDLIEQLQRLEASRTPSDDFGKFSNVEKAAQDERYFGKAATFDWLEGNPTATLEETAAYFEARMLEYRTAAGRPWLLQRGEGLVREWMANALARGLVADDTWDTFVRFLLGLGKDAALGVSG